MRRMDFVLVHGMSHGACRVAHRVCPAAVVVPHGSSLLETHRPLPGRSLFRGLGAGGAGLVHPWIERVDLRGFCAMAVPRTSIRCRRDVAVPPARAAEYAGRLGVRPVDLDSDHGPMLSHPDELARLLERVCAGG